MSEEEIHQSETHIEQANNNTSSHSGSLPTTKLYVGNLSWTVTPDTLKDIFSKFGEVTDAYVSTDRDTGKSKGFGFITFTEILDAQKARDTLNATDLSGRTIKIDFAQARPDRPPRDGFSGRGGYNGERKDYPRDNRRDFNRDERAPKEYDRNERHAPRDYSDRQPARDIERDRDYDRAPPRDDRNRDSFRERDSERDYVPRGGDRPREERRDYADRGHSSSRGSSFPDSRDRGFDDRNSRPRNDYDIKSGGRDYDRDSRSNFPSDSRGSSNDYRGSDYPRSSRGGLDEYRSGGRDLPRDVRDTPRDLPRDVPRRPDDSGRSGGYRDDYDRNSSRPADFDRPRDDRSRDFNSRPAPSRDYNPAPSRGAYNDRRY